MFNIDIEKLNKTTMKNYFTRLRFVRQMLLLSLFSFGFATASYSIGCADIEGFEFTNGSLSQSIEDGATYSLVDLPAGFYIEAILDDNPGSVRFELMGEDGLYYTVLENYHPYTFPGGNVAWALPAGDYTLSAEVYSFIFGIGQLCDESEISFTIEDGECDAFAGTMTAMSSEICLNGEATLSANAAGDAIIPDGYSQLFVLTQGEGLTIINASASPEFTVDGEGLYTIHSLVFNPATIDLDIVELGVTTGVDVLGLLIEGGGDICASLDVAGAAFNVAAPDAGTLTADMDEVCLDGPTTISATPNGDINVPEGYSSVYVLTKGAELTIVNAGGEPSFEVEEGGMYTIHTLVYNPESLDLGIVQLGVTTGVDVFGLIVPGGGEICASLDVAGAPINVAAPDAGTLTADMDQVCLNGPTTISATPNGDINVPDGYASIYVLTKGAELTIVDAGGEPSFEVEEGGMYTIHTLVYNPESLDLGIVQLGVTTGVDVFGLIVPGGGEICASLDVAGAPINVDAPDAGTLTADMDEVCFNGPTTISATPNGDINVPDGYSSIYVLTKGAELTIVNAGGEPSFEVEEGGMYTIHTLVYDPATLDLGIVDLGVTTGVDVFGLIVPGGGDICASLDVAGAPINVAAPDAGTLTADMDQVCLNGPTTISATPNGDINVPEGYSSVYVLTKGAELTIVNAGGEPSFEVEEGGMYTIHTLVYNPESLDLGIVQFGITTGVDVFGLIVSGGGDICASLDVAGAPINVDAPDAGTLTADMDEVCFNGPTTISATPNGDINVPDGYSSIYVLTKGAELTIVGAGGEPSFEVEEGGMYTIHTLVYNPESLDLGIVQFGITTGVDVFGLIVPGGGDICASLDVAGAPINVAAPDAGTLTADASPVNLNGTATISATPNGDINVPDGYSSVYVLTMGAELTIVNAGAVPSFEVSEAGMYTIHTLVYDPNTLDLGIVELGVTTGVDVFGLIVPGGGEICADLDVAGAQIDVEEIVCDADAGTMSADMMSVCLDGETTISATANGDAIIPEGYVQAYVLTMGEDLVIMNAGGEPSFEVSEGGLYTIHSLVYDPSTLDLSIVDLGVTTGVDVFGLIVPGGGEICASLDVAGAPINVDAPNAGTLTADMDMVTLNGSATISATPNGDINVPEGYSYIYVLTMGAELTIMNCELRA